jgi:hypothetical protein
VTGRQETAMALHIVTFDRLGDIPDAHLDTLVTWLTEAMLRAFASAARVAQVFAVLVEVLQGEQRRRVGRLAHAAPALTVELPTVGELSDTEMRDLMRWLQEQGREASGGMPDVTRFVETVLGALETTRAHQRSTLERMDHDLR